MYLESATHLLNIYPGNFDLLVFKLCDDKYFFHKYLHFGFNENSPVPYF